MLKLSAIETRAREKIIAFIHLPTSRKISAKIIYIIYRQNHINFLCLTFNDAQTSELTRLKSASSQI